MKKEKGSAKRSFSRPPRAPLVEIGVGAAWLVGLCAALLLLELLLGRSPLGAALAGAVLADVVAGLAGVRWDTSEGSQPAAGSDGSTAFAIRRTAIGAGIAVVVVFFTVVVAVALGWARVEGGEIAKSVGLAAIRAGAIGVKEELFLRGIVLVAAARAGIRPWIAAVFSALAGGAVIALAPGVGPAAIALTVGSGFLFATLWQRYQGAWAAVGAHGVWIFALGSGLRGGLLDVGWTSGGLSTGPRSFGAPAILAAVICVLMAVGIRVWRPKGEPSTPAAAP